MLVFSPFLTTFSRFTDTRSSEIKLRSFYRKLNRWGFSLVRKRAGEQDNLWSHPDFNRDVAVKALNKALELGRTVQFLPLTGYAQAQNRRKAYLNSQNSLFSLSRSTPSNVGSSTILPAVLPSSDKMWKLSNSFTSIETHHREQQQRQKWAVSSHTTGILSYPFSSPSRVYSSASMFDVSAPLNTSMQSSPQQENGNVQRSMISSSSDGDNHSSALQRRQLLQRELTPEEDKELSDFLGWFAQRLSDNEEGVGKSDP